MSGLNPTVAASQLVMADKAAEAGSHPWQQLQVGPGHVRWLEHAAKMLCKACDLLATATADWKLLQWITCVDVAQPSSSMSTRDWEVAQPTMLAASCRQSHL